MSEGGLLTIAVICEAAADQRTACLLADRVACESIDWLEADYLDSARCWRGTSSSSDFLPWKAVRREADRLSVVAHGHFSGEPGAPDARAARLALFVVKKAIPDLAAVLLIRDTDNDLQRRRGLDQARDCAPWPFAIIIGLAHAERECWPLAAFDPAERGKTKERSAKRALADLCSDGGERVLTETPLSVLKQRGKDNGLARYLAELESLYVPLFRRTGSGRSSAA